MAVSVSPSISATVFRSQFDMAALQRRFPSRLTPIILAAELKRRWTCLQRMRWAAECGSSVWGNQYSLKDIRQDMWTAFLLVIENDGKNWNQLVGWAKFPQYIQAFVKWNLLPASLSEELPEATEERSLGVWLLWFLVDFDSTMAKEALKYPQLDRLIIPLAFSSYAYAGAHHQPWHQFSSLPNSSFIDNLDQALLPPLPRPSTPRPLYKYISTFPKYLNTRLQLLVPLISEAASNIYFKKLEKGAQHPAHSLPRDSLRYDCDWIVLSQSDKPSMFKDLLSPFSPYVPGTLTGIWEGRFVAPGSDTYIKLQEGSPPLATYEAANIFQHFQTWRIQEHYAVNSKVCHGDKFTPSNRLGTISHRQGKSAHALRPGPAMRAHLPAKTRISPVKNGVTVWTPETPNGRSLFYQTWSEDTTSEIDLDEGLINGAESDGKMDDFVEIIVTGETSPSILAPTQVATMMHLGSTVKGTIRKRDGLIVLHVKPFQRSSGKWLYIGRVTSAGVWNGKWRARDETPNSLAYEGVYQMRKLDTDGSPQMDF